MAETKQKLRNQSFVELTADEVATLDESLLASFIEQFTHFDECLK
jgi:hypothetical protein